jgi:hypothetical protein
VKLIDEALPDQALSKALARGGRTGGPPWLLPSKPNWFCVSAASAAIFIRPPGVDNAPYLTALVQSSLIAIPSGTAAEAAASMSHCRSGAAVSPQKADPIRDGRGAITSRKAMELLGTAS